MDGCLLNWISNPWVPQEVFEHKSKNSLVLMNKFDPHYFGICSEFGCSVLILSLLLLPFLLKISAYHK